MPRVRISLTNGKQFRVWMLLLGLLLVVAGCGGSDEEQAPVPKALVPATLPADATVDSLTAVADSVAVSAEAALPAEDVGPGTIPPAPAAPAAPAPRLQTPPPPPPARSGPYSLQMGSFRSEANAMERLEKIRELGFDATVEMADIGGMSYFRIVLLGLDSREKAVATGEKIRTALDTEYLVRRTD